jgi:aminopeptidase N
MENTSATLHADQVQQDARELVDGNGWEETIAHELFHQWFGDYVTAESWSNITLNESFADYSETLWKEYKYGKDVSQEQLYADRRNYWGNPGNAEVNLVRFNYRNALDVFDGVSYQTGGNILHMLRKFVGDEAFSQSLKNYLQTNKYRNGEAQQLRLAFEEVTGKDLNWFFNQWYYGKGHPKLDISYDYSTPGSVSVNIRQTQGGTPFQLPLDIDIHTGNQVSRHQVWMKDSVATFVFPIPAKPDLVNVDGDKDLLLEKTDHKTPSELLYQYQHATGYINRREAVAFFINTPDAAGRTAFLLQAFNDPRASLRRMILTNINYGKDAFAKDGLAIVRAKAAKENDKTVQAAAVNVLGSIKDGSSLSLLKSLTRDQSYSVAGNALLAVASMDSVAALSIARSLISQPAKGNLLAALTSVLAKYGTAQDDKYIYDQFELAGINGRIGMLNDLGIALQKSNDDAFVNQQLAMLTIFKNELPAFFGEFASPLVEKVVNDVAEARKNRNK